MTPYHISGPIIFPVLFLHSFRENGVWIYGKRRRRFPAQFYYLSKKETVIIDIGSSHTYFNDMPLSDIITIMLFGEKKRQSGFS